MKLPPAKMKEDIRRLAENWRVEFDLDVYQMLGALMMVVLEVWYEHDLDERIVDHDEDDDE